MTASPSPELQRVRLWVRAALVVFCMLGISFGTWLSRLPAVRDHLDASTLQMSIYGFCLALGSLTGLAFSGRTVAWLGARRTLLIGMPLQAVFLTTGVLLLWAHQVVPGVAVLFLFGVSFSTSDVAINVTGAEAERALGRPRMPLLHAAYSLGSVASMGIGAGAEALHVPVPIHAAVMVAIVAVASLIALRWVPRDRSGRAAPEDQPKPPSVLTGPTPVLTPAGAAAPASPKRYNPWRDPRIYLVGTIALSMSLMEGTGSDWLSLALVDGRGFANSFATLMVGVFFVAMVVTRATGSLVLMRFGRVAVIRGGALLCIVGTVVVILVPAPWAAVVGAVLWGAGCALGFPVGISAAADDPEHAVKSVAAVSAIAYGAYLVGPMLIGFLGEHLGLLRAFWPLVAIALLCFAIAGAAREPARAETAPAER